MSLIHVDTIKFATHALKEKIIINAENVESRFKSGFRLGILGEKFFLKKINKFYKKFK
jgi:hypothetical protein